MGLTSAPVVPVVVYDDATVHAKLTDYIAAHGYRTAAERIGIPHTNLYAMRKGERPITPKVLAALGLRRAVVGITPEGR